MIGLSTFTPRMWLILAHDLIATASAIVGSFFIRFEEAGLIERWRLLVTVVPVFVLYAAFVYGFFGLYKSKWRFTSLPDLHNIVRSAAVLAGVGPIRVLVLWHDFPARPELGIVVAGIVAECLPLLVGHLEFANVETIHIHDMGRALASLVSCLARLLVDDDSILEVDLNPVIASAESAIAVDALVVRRVKAR